MSSNYFREPRPARQIPTRKQLTAASRRQALLEARSRQQPSRHHIGSNSGLHPEEDEEEILDEDWPSRLPPSAIRYQVSPEQDFQSGNKRYHVTYVDVPKRSSRQPKQLPPAHPRDRFTEEVAALPKAKHHKRNIHPLLYLGVGMIAMAALFLLLSSATTWIQTTKDDLTYGRPRTFHIDAFVGHNDSVSNPSHFIALNLNRHVQVIEIPGQDSTKERTFQITTLFGDGEDLTPVTLSFRDLTGNGKFDMLIHIQDQTIVMINENGTFRPAKPGEVKGLL